MQNSFALSLLWNVVTVSSTYQFQNEGLILAFIHHFSSKSHLKINVARTGPNGEPMATPLIMGNAWKWDLDILSILWAIYHHSFSICYLGKPSISKVDCHADRYTPLISTMVYYLFVKRRTRAETRISYSSSSSSSSLLSAAAI